jgi:hypothetical protein
VQASSMREAPTCCNGIPLDVGAVAKRSFIRVYEIQERCTLALC